MKRLIVCSLMLLAPLAFRAVCAAPLASVPAAFVPNQGSGFAEPLSVAGFYFEVNQATGRARIVLDYTYPGQQSVESVDRHRPDPSYVQPSNLVYDPATRAVIYQHDGKATVCATVSGKRRAKVKSTGNCSVTAAYVEHASDNGWTVIKRRTLETTLETR